MGYERVELEWHEDHATVWLSQPERRNSLSERTLSELRSALAEVGDSEVAGLVLAARGPVFSSGHDFADMRDRDLLSMRRLLDLCSEVMLMVQRLPQVVVARVQGHAVAAGCQLVASADLAVAVDSAGFATPGGKGGWFCHTPMVAVGRAVPRKRAMELALTGDMVDAATAADWGLINRAVPEDQLDEAVMDLLGRATRGSRASKAIGKSTLHRQLDLGIDEAYAYAGEVMAATSQLADAKENMAAFVEKRRPEWRHQ